MMDRRKTVMRQFEAQKEWTRRYVADGIERWRKGDFTLKFVDHAYQPLQDVNVELVQTAHDFNFGANIFMLDEFETEEKNAAYREDFANLFNMATLPFYWADLEPKEDQLRFTKDSPRIYRRPTPDLCLEYCKEKGIRPKAHCLNYDQWTPAWVPHEISQIKTLLDRRMARLSERYGKDIKGWEVTNELLLGKVFEPAQNRVSTPFFDADDILEWSFDTARRHFPLNELIINEAGFTWEGFQGNRTPYYMQVQRALASGAPINAIGLQCHMFIPREKECDVVETRYNPQHIAEVMDRYTDFNRPIQITEITVPAYSKDPEDEAIQAEIAENLYSLWFASEKTESIIYWNTVDGYAAFAPQGDMTAGENYYHGALIDFNGRKKPIYRTLERLIKKDWHTAAAFSTGEGNAHSLRAFYGDYRLTCTHDGKRQTVSLRLSEDGDRTLYVVLD